MAFCPSEPGSNPGVRGRERPIFKKKFKEAKNKGFKSLCYMGGEDLASGEVFRLGWIGFLHLLKELKTMMSLSSVSRYLVPGPEPGSSGGKTADWPSRPPRRRRGHRSHRCTSRWRWTPQRRT